MSSQAQYRPSFYRSLNSQAVNSAREILPFVFELFNPQSVVDVGCGTGEWLSVCSELGAEITGYDFHNGSILNIPKDRFITHDLTKPIETDRKFDLALSLEVGEHLPPEKAETFIWSITNLAPVVLFSAAIPMQGGTGHVNEQWPDYWAKLFEQQGFKAVDCVRPRFWSNSNVTGYYAQNAVLYVRDQQLNGVPCFALERFVHPGLWVDQATELRGLRPLYTARGLVKRLPGALWNSISDRARRLLDR